MADKEVIWRAVANFSSVRKEAAKTQASLAALQAEVDDINASNNKLGKSEDALASKIGKANKDTTTSLAAATAARKRAQTAADKLSSSLQSEAKATNSSTLASVKNTLAKYNEATAKNNVAEATNKFTKAQQKATTAEKALRDAELARAKVQGNAESTLEDLTKAENQYTKAKSASAKASDDAEKAAQRLQKAQLRQAVVQSQNAVAAQRDFDKQAKAAETAAQREINAAQKAASAIEAAKAKEARATELAAQRGQRAAQKAAREEEAAQAQQARAAQRLASMRESLARQSALLNARRNAPQQSVSSGLSESTNQADLSKIRQQIELLKQSTTLTSDQQAAEARLQRSSDSLDTARQRAIGSTNRLNKNLRNLEEAKTRVSLATSAEQSAASELDRVRSSSSSTVDDLNKAESRLLSSRRELTFANGSLLKAEQDVSSSRSRVAETTAIAKAAEDRLTESIRRTRNELGLAGGDGNKFTNILDRIGGSLGDSGDAAKAFGSAMSLIKWPAIIGAIYELLSVLSALVTGLFEVASAAAPAVGAVAALGPAIIGAASVAGTLFSAFHGVVGVLKAYDAAQKSATKNGATAAKSARDSARQVADAKDSLAKAQQNVTLTAHQGSESLASAAHDIIEANRQQLESEQALNQARKDAIQNIQQLKNSVVDAALAEKGATLDLASAKANLQQVLADPNSTRLQRQQAQLEVQNAAQQVVEAKQSNTQTQRQERVAVKQGVSGSPAVKQARQAVNDATYNSAQARQKQRDTTAEVARNNADAIQAVVKAQQALADAQDNASNSTNSVATATNNYKAQLAKLSPAAQAFVKQLISMKKYWKDMETAASQGLFPGLTAALKNLIPLAPVIDSLFNGMGKVIGGLALQFSKLASSTKWVSSLKYVGTQSEGIVHTLGKAFLDLVDAFRAVTVAATPMTEELARGFRLWAQHLDQIATAPGAYQKMVTWFQKSYTTLHQVGQILKNVGGAVFNMGRAAGIAGKSLLDSMQKITKRWSDWTGSATGQTQLIKFFDNVRDNLRLIDAGIGHIVKGFFKLGSNQSLQPIIKALSNLWAAIKNMIGSSGNGQGIADIINNIAKALNGMAGVGSILTGFIKGIGLVTGALAWFVDHKSVADTLGAIFIALGAYKALKFASTVTGLGSLARGLSSFTKAAKNVPEGSTLGQRIIGGVAGTRTSKEGTKAAKKGESSALGSFIAGRQAKRRAKAGGIEEPPTPTIVQQTTSSGQVVYRDTTTGRMVSKATAEAAGVITEPTPTKPSLRSRVAGVFSHKRNATPEEGIRASQEGAAGAAGIVPGLLGGAPAEEEKTKKGGFFSRLRNRSPKGDGGSASLPGSMTKAASSGLGRVSAASGAIAGAAAFATMIPGMQKYSKWLNTIAVATGALSAVTALLTAALDSETLSTVAAAAASKIAAAAQWLFNAAMDANPFVLVGLAIAAVVVGVIEAYKHFTTFRNIVNDVASAFVWLWNKVLVPLGEFLLGHWKLILQVVSLAFGPIGVAIALIITHFNTFKKVVTVVADAIVKAVKVLASAVEKVWKLWWAALKLEWRLFWDFITGAWDVAKTVASKSWSAITGVVSKVWDSLWGGLKQSWGTFWGWLKAAWNAVSGVASSIWKGIVSAITKAFSVLNVVVDSIWNKVKSSFASAINFITQKILNNLIKAINAVTHLFGIKRIPLIPAISTGNTPSGPNSAHGNGRPSASGGRAFKRGGVTPGYTPGRDVHEFYSPTGGSLALSGGEGILVPEATRALGGAKGINAINSQFSSRVPGSGLGFKGGGIWGDIWGAAKDIGSGGLNLLRGGLASVTKAGLNAAESPLRALISKIPLEILRKIVNGMFDKVNNGIYNLIAGNNAKAQSSVAGNGESLVWANLISNGFTAAQAAGIMGNMQSESGFDPHILQGGGYSLNPADAGSGGYGLVQWTPGSKLIPYLNNQLPTIPSEVSALAAQLAGRGPSPEGAAGAALAATKTPAAAATAFGLMYERYAGGLQPSRATQAQSIYQQFAGNKKFANGGVIQNFHTGGVVPGLSSNAAASKGLAALFIQSGLGWTTGSTKWTSSLTNVYKNRLAGVNAYTDVKNTNAVPTVMKPFGPTDKRISGLENWIDANAPSSYNAMWEGEPYTSSGWPNSFNRSPLLPVLAYLGDPKGFQNYRVDRDQAYMDKVTGKKQKAAVTAYKKSHATTYKNLQAKESAWTKYVSMITAALGIDKADVSSLRGLLGIKGESDNSGLFSQDMVGSMDHAAAHALGIDHPADWPTPWASGSKGSTESAPATSVQGALAAQERSNALNQQWFDDLTTLADWGLSALVDNLISQGVSDGAVEAHSAAKNRAAATQLNEAIEAGAAIGGGPSNQQTILQVVAKVASGNPNAPFGLRDISSYLNAPDYTVVNLWDQGLSAALEKIPDNLTSKLVSDVGLFRQGLFYANSGAVVPGSGNKDTVPAMLTPGEGVLNTMAMRLLGVNNFHKLNNGVQAFASGGIVLAPNVSSATMLGAVSSASTTNVRNGRGGNYTGPASVVLETNIYNPTGENSVLSMTKNLRRQAAMGTVAKATGAGK